MNLRSGYDYVYHGSSSFRGLHTGCPPRLRQEKLRDRYVLREVSIEREISPEYYLIHVEQFEDHIRTPLDEWIYMLKHESVRDDFRSRNIGKAREKLAVMKMTPEKRRAYEKYMMDVVSERDIMRTAYEEEWMEGWKEGKTKGRMKGRYEEGYLDIARNMLREGLGVALIAKVTGLSVEEIQAMDGNGPFEYSWF